MRKERLSMFHKLCFQCIRASMEKFALNPTLNSIERTSSHILFANEVAQVPEGNATSICLFADLVLSLDLR